MPAFLPGLDDHTHLQCRQPEVLGPLLLTPDSAFLVAGGVSGAVYTWDLGTGELVGTVRAHHGRVRCAAATDDGALLFTGGDDGAVRMWSALDLVGGGGSDGRRADLGRGDGLAVRELHTWTDHSLAVTCMQMGSGGARGRLFTASLDQTVQIREVCSRRTLATLVMRGAVTGLAVDPDERWLGASSGAGVIELVDLRHAASDPCQGSGGASAGATRMMLEATSSLLEGHTLPVSCMATARQGLRLVSGSEDGTVRVWDVQSRQCVQVIDCKSPVTTLLVASEQPDLAVAADDRTCAPFPPLKRFASAPAGQGHAGTAQDAPPPRTSLKRRQTHEPALAVSLLRSATLQRACGASATGAAPDMAT